MQNVFQGGLTRELRSCTILRRVRPRKRLETLRGLTPPGSPGRNPRMSQQETPSPPPAPAPRPRRRGPLLFFLFALALAGASWWYNYTRSEGYQARNRLGEADRLAQRRPPP